MKKVEIELWLAAENQSEKKVISKKLEHDVRGLRITDL